MSANSKTKFDVLWYSPAAIRSWWRISPSLYAKKNSKDPGSGANGGDLDWATAASYVPEFAEAMVKLKKGEMTQVPVKSQFGWHVIRVDDIREAQLPKLDDVRPQIAQQLQQQKLAQFQEGLRKSAKIE